jgi:hypothetical protein
MHSLPSRLSQSQGYSAILIAMVRAGRRIQGLHSSPPLSTSLQQSRDYSLRYRAKRISAFYHTKKGSTFAEQPPPLTASREVTDATRTQPVGGGIMIHATGFGAEIGTDDPISADRAPPANAPRRNQVAPEQQLAIADAAVPQPQAAAGAEDNGDEDAKSGKSKENKESHVRPDPGLKKEKTWLQKKKWQVCTAAAKGYIPNF